MTFSKERFPENFLVTIHPPEYPLPLATGEIRQPRYRTQEHKKSAVMNARGPHAQGVHAISPIETGGHMEKINVLDQEITVKKINEDDYICITDIARYKNSDRTDDLIRNWLRSRNTIEFLGLWEHLNNVHFKPVEFDGFRKQAGL